MKREGSREALRRLLSQVVVGAGHQAQLALHPLYEYDAEHGGDLVRTLQVYLALGCNASRASEALYLHRSGLLYRLRRIEELLGVRLDVFEDRVALEVAALVVLQETNRPGDEARQIRIERKR